MLGLMALLRIKLAEIETKVFNFALYILLFAIESYFCCYLILYMCVCVDMHDGASVNEDDEEL
jgi:hypothetical protein